MLNYPEIYLSTLCAARIKVNIKLFLPLNIPQCPQIYRITPDDFKSVFFRIVIFSENAIVIT